MIGKYCIIEKPVEIGEGTEILHYVTIRPGVKIGTDCSIRNYCHLAEGCEIGDNVSIYQFSNISAGSKIGDNVFIGSRVTFTNTKRISHGRRYKPCIEPIVVQDGVRIASGVVILPGVTLGKECLIGVGSVVTKDTEPFGVYYGNPATLKRVVPEEERL